MKKQILGSIAALSATLTIAAPKNFVVIITDDQGYGDLSCYGSEYIRTPNIDALAKDGVKLTSFYAAAVICTPSRAGLMTGRMAIRSDMTRIEHHTSEHGMSPNEITLGEMFKTKGYKTAALGKWHLGHLPVSLPKNQGFDYYYGTPNGHNPPINDGIPVSKNVILNDGYTLEKLQSDVQFAKTRKGKKELGAKPPIVENLEIVEYPIQLETLTKRLTDKAVDFIDENKENPFFLYLAHSMPHNPIAASEKFEKNSEYLYSATIEEIDWSVGEVMKALEENGLADDTMVIFTTDNGPNQFGKPPVGGSAGHLRGRKADTFEGGQRVPGIIRYPREIKAGWVSNEMVSSLDFFPTFANYIGYEMPTDREYDGYDIGDFLAGKTKESPRKEVYYYCAGKTEIDGVRVGDWKYLKRGDDAVGKEKKFPDVNPMLFNMRDDEGEKKNVIKSHPEKAEELKQKLEKFDAHQKQAPCNTHGAGNE